MTYFRSTLIGSMLGIAALALTLSHTNSAKASAPAAFRAVGCPECTPPPVCPPDNPNCDQPQRPF